MLRASPFTCGRRPIAQPLRMQLLRARPWTLIIIFILTFFYEVPIDTRMTRAFPSTCGRRPYRSTSTNAAPPRMPRN